MTLYHPRTVSYHLLRRRARARAAAWDATHGPEQNAVVVKTKRGPWRWRVEIHRRLPPLD